MRSGSALAVSAVLACVIAASRCAVAQVDVIQDSFLKASFNPTGDLIAPLSPSGEKQHLPNAHGVQFNPAGTGVFTDNNELLTGGLTTPVGESYLVTYNTPFGPDSFLNGGFGATTSVSLAGNMADFTITNGTFAIMQHSELQTIDGIHRLSFTVDLKNISGADLTNVGYIRSVFPKQGLSPGSPVSATALDFHLASPELLPGGVAIDSTIPGLDESPDQRHFAVGSATINGSIVPRVNVFGDANNPSPNLQDYFNNGYYELEPGGTIGAFGSPIINTSGSPPFAINLFYDIGAIPNNGTVDLGPFYYIFSAGLTTAAVPEPGPPALAMALAALGSVCALRKVRRRHQA